MTRQRSWVHGLQPVGVAPTLLHPDWPLLQLPGAARPPVKQHCASLHWVLELKPCQRQRTQAEQALAGGTTAGEPPGMWSPSLGASLVLCWQKWLQMQLHWDNRMCQVLIIEVVGDKEEPQCGLLSAKSLNPVCRSGKQKEYSVLGP
jgi:hypothetical protein